MVVTNTMGAAELLCMYLESDAGSGVLAEMVKMAGKCSGAAGEPGVPVEQLA